MEREAAKKARDREDAMRRAKEEWIQEQKRALQEREKAQAKIKKEQEEKEKLKMAREEYRNRVMAQMKVVQKREEKGRKW